MWEARPAAILFRMNGMPRYESMDGLGRAKQDARAEGTWQKLFPTIRCISSILGGQMCGATESFLHHVLEHRRGARLPQVPFQ